MTDIDVTPSLEQRIEQLAGEPGAVACVWLGQAGFLFKSPAGVTVMVDPYLSDYAEEMWGLRRVLPPAIDPARFRPDLLLVSHWHEDHLDAPLVRRYAKEPDVVFAGPGSCVARAQAWGWPAERTVTIERGGRHRMGDVEVTATFARHEVPGALSEDAVGFLLDIGGVRVWDVADTEYDARLRPLREERVDVMLVPINGVGGNLDAHEAALLAWQVRPRIAIPMHYNMWSAADFGPGATLDPALFRETLGKIGGGIEVRVLAVGEIVAWP